MPTSNFLSSVFFLLSPTASTRSAIGFTVYAILVAMLGILVVYGGDIGVGLYSATIMTSRGCGGRWNCAACCAASTTVRAGELAD